MLYSQLFLFSNSLLGSGVRRNAPLLQPRRLNCPSVTHARAPFRRVMLLSSSPLHRLAGIQRHFRMDVEELKNFLADSPPTTVNLVIKKHFEALTDQQARYAHYISRYDEALESRYLKSSHCHYPLPSDTDL
jgi:hypothetical protein